MKPVSKIITFFIALISVSGFSCYAGGLNNNAIFSHLTIKEGLSENSASSIYKDHEGFMWFATNNGLNRYDGYEIRAYLENPEDTAPVHLDRIRYICEDADSTLWMLTSHQVLLSFDKRTEKFREWPCLPDTVSTFDGTRNLVIDETNHIWVLKNSGRIQIFSLKTHTFSRLEKEENTPAPIKNIRTGYIRKGKGNTVWLINGGRLIRLEYASKKYNEYYLPQKKNAGKSKPPTEIYGLQEINANTVWLSTSEGFCSFNKKTGEFHFYNKLIRSGIQITSFLVASDNIIWAGTKKGLYAFDPQTDNLYSFANNPNDPFAFHGVDIMRIYEDDEGLIWISSETNGVNIFSKESNRFGTMRPGQKTHAVSSVLRDKNGLLWVGLFNEGLKVFDNNGESNIMNKFHLDGTGPEKNVYYIYSDSKNNIWLGQNTAHISRYNPSTHVFKSWSTRDFSSEVSPLGAVLHMVEKNDTLWISSNTEGLLIFDLIHEKYLPWQGDVKLKNEIASNGLQMVYFDNNGKTWLATTLSGLLSLDNKKIKYYSSKKNKIGSDLVTYILEDKPGYMWVSTYGDGLKYFDINRNKVYTISEKDGLCSNYIYALLRDKHGRLWLSTDKGISCYTPEIITTGKELKVGGIFKNFYEEDGLQGNEFNQDAVFQDGAGNMYFGGTNGLNIFNPDSLRDNALAPRVYITGIRLFNRQVKAGFLKRVIEFTKKVVFSYKDNIISFEFAGLSFSNPSKNQYAYKMEGFDKDWIYTDAGQRLATYTNLDPGEYTFRVIASNNDGVWNKNGASIHIIITPPFYRTWWFISLIVLTILCFTVWIARFASMRKYRKRLQEMEHQREIENVRSRIASDIHDDIGSGLTQISLIAEIVKTNEKQGKNTLHLIDKLNNSARAMIDNLGEIVWTINPKHDTINSLLSYFSNYISGFLSDTEINYTIDFRECVPDRTIHPELRRNLFMVLKEAVTNIAKHAEARNASFVFHIEGDDLSMEIKDDGIGIKEENKSPFGNGLKNMQSRMQDIAGTFEIKSNDKGTTIIIKGKII